MPDVEKLGEKEEENTSEEYGEIESPEALSEEDIEFEQLLAIIRRYAEDPAVIEAGKRRDRERFGDKIEECRLRDGETPEDFEKRLHLLYPEEGQKAYITALMLVSKAIQYAEYTPYGGKENKVWKELGNVYTKNPDGALYMTTDFSNELIYACNGARKHLEERTKEFVEEERNELEEEILAKKKSGDKTFDIAMKMLNFISKPSEEVIYQEKQKVTASSLWLSTPYAAEAFNEISLSSREAIYSRKLKSARVDILSACREMGIYIVPTDLDEVYSRVLMKEEREENGNLIEDSRLRKGETPEKFEKALHRLYPEEAQKAYITALMRISQAIVYAQCYSDESEEVRRMYMKDEEGTLYMSEEYYENLIAACYPASWHLEKVSNDLVEEERSKRVEVLSKKKILDSSALDITIEELTDPPQEVRDQVKQKITAKSLRLTTPAAAKALDNILALLRSGYIDSEELFRVFMTITPASDEMGIYHIDYTDFGKVYSRVLRKGV